MEVKRKNKSKSSATVTDGHSNKKQFEKPAQNGTNNKKKQFSKQPPVPAVKHREEQKWFEYQVNEVISNPAKDGLKDDAATKLFEEAELLLSTDCELYEKKLRTEGGSEGNWLLSVVKKGTASDRMTAMQLQMGKSPVHSLPYAETLITIIEKKNTREVTDVLPILEEVFKDHFLPVNRKLVSFSSRPLARINEICSNSELSRKRTLVLWMFEHKLKLSYARFLRSLEGIAAGVVEDLCKKAVKTAQNLLSERPEAEQVILTLLVNKLGHPNRHVGAHVARCLEDLTKRQPNMRPVIVRETERLVYRKNISEQAHLYAATFLTQIALRTGETELAVNLLSIYFGLFKTLIAKKMTDNRILNVLLIGANRAFPFAKESANALTEDINSLYKIVHTGSYSIALQTLKLLYQILHLSDQLTDRYYSSLYRKLLDPIPPNSYNQLMLLVFKSMKTDPSENRARVFVKRLLQIATGATPSMAAGIIILVSKLAEERHILLVLESSIDLLSRTEINLVDDEEETYVDLDTEGKPIDRNLKKEEILSESEDEEMETKPDGKKLIKGSLGPSSVGGWIHKSSRQNASRFDHGARNPLFIDCKNSADCELLLLSKHYHPSVAIFAQQLMEGKYVNYRGDPLQDFTMMKFLDRFAYKNPKDGSAPVSSGSVGKKKAYDPWGIKKLDVRSKEYVNKKTEELPPDERYLHRFTKLKFENVEKKQQEDDWDVESVNSEEFESILERFEPGEANDEFDVDFGQEFSAEKQKKKSAQKRKAAEDASDGEDDELSDYGDMDVDDEDNEEGLDGNFDDDEDDEDIEMDSDGEDDDDAERAFSKAFNKAGAGSDSDDDFDEKDEDADRAADRFGMMLEDFEDHGEASSQKKLKRKTQKPKGFKKRR